MCRPSPKGVGTPTVLCGGFFSGLLETLLGKPGTLHSPGRIFTSALGVPPDLRGAPVLEGREGSTAGWRVLAASSPISWVEFAFVTRQGRSPAQSVVGSSSNSFTPRPSTCYFFFRPQRGVVSTFPPPRCGQGGVRRLTLLVLHSTPQSATVWIGRLRHPVRNRMYTW